MRFLPDFSRFFAPFRVLFFLRTSSRTTTRPLCSATFDLLPSRCETREHCCIRRPISIWNALGRAELARTVCDDEGNDKKNSCAALRPADATGTRNVRSVTNRIHRRSINGGHNGRVVIVRYLLFLIGDKRFAERRHRSDDKHIFPSCCATGLLIVQIRFRQIDANVGNVSPPPPDPNSRIRSPTFFGRRHASVRSNTDYGRLRARAPETSRQLERRTYVKKKKKFFLNLRSSP